MSNDECYDEYYHITGFLGLSCWLFCWLLLNFVTFMVLLGNLGELQSGFMGDLDIIEVVC